MDELANAVTVTGLTKRDLFMELVAFHNDAKIKEKCRQVYISEFLIQVTDPNSLCRLCVAGSAHTLRMHAKLVRAVTDEALAEIAALAEPITLPTAIPPPSAPQGPQGPQGGRKARLVPPPKLNPRGPSGVGVALPDYVGKVL